MKKNFRIISLLLTCLLFFMLLLINEAAGQIQKDPNLSQDIIATVGEESITVNDFMKEMARRGGHIPGRFSTMDEREALLEEMIRFEVLVHEAKKAGYEKDPEIIASLKKMMLQRFWQDQMETRMKDIQVTDEEISAYYEDHLEAFKEPKMARVAVIYLKSPANASEEDIQRLKEKAQKIIEKTKQQDFPDQSFGHLAEDYSDDEGTRYRGGDIGWVSEGANIFKWDKLVIDAIFQIKTIGEISPVIHTSKGLYIIKLMDKTEGGVKSLNQVKKVINETLLSAKKRKIQDEYYQNIKENVEINIDRELLRSFRFSTKTSESESGPPPFPIGINSE